MVGDNVYIKGKPALTSDGYTHKRFFSRRKATFDFIFDGAKDTDNLAMSIFEEYGFKANFAFDDSNNANERIKLYQEARVRGHGMMVHSSIDFTDSLAITYQEVDDAMKAQVKFFEDHGIPVSGFVPLGSAIHDDFMPLVEKYFGYAFTGKEPFDNHSSDPIKLRRKGLEVLINGVSIQPVLDIIDAAILANTKITFYAHRIPSDYNTGGTSWMTEQNLRDILTYVKDKVENGECRVMESDEAMESYYKAPFI